jgi:hypothetical protein
MISLFDVNVPVKSEAKADLCLDGALKCAGD